MAYNKKAVYEDEAQRLYVTEQLSGDAIAQRLNLSTKTISTWKIEGEWERKRAEYLRQKQSFHEELYDFSRILLKKVKEDIASGKDPNSGQLYTLTKLLGTIGKVKNYEDTSATKESATVEDKETIISAIEDYLGLA